jgi:hypothetical protein
MMGLKREAAAVSIVAIDQIFSAGALSTWFFLIENGQGCYIPAYQRQYSWDRENVSRLFEDAANGIEQLLVRPSTIGFLGIIIAIHDTKHATVKPLLKAEMPQKVMTIIDGQQRICTMMMIKLHSMTTFTLPSDLASRRQPLRRR